MPSYILTSSCTLGGDWYVLPEKASRDALRTRRPVADKYADVTLCVGPDKKEIPTSRLLLTLHSKFFQDYFEAEGDMAKDPCGQRVVPLPDLDSRVVGSLVEGLLSGWVDISDELEALEKLFHAVDYLQLQAFDGALLTACRWRAYEEARKRKKALAAYLSGLASLAERYNRTRVTAFITHLVTEDPEVWELQEDQWPSTLSCQAAMKKLRASQKLMGAKFPTSNCDLAARASRCSCSGL